jgi:hypothetical protein
MFVKKMNIVWFDRSAICVIFMNNNLYFRVNYFVNLGAECHFPKLECSEYSFSKERGVSIIYPKIKNKIKGFGGPDGNALNP